MGPLQDQVKAVSMVILFVLFGYVRVQAATDEYDLTIAEEEINITGKPTRGMTVNGGIPGPVLRFKEGHTARIRVHNQMDVETSIHWHGILVPPGMDGVPNVSFPPIEPGATFTYEFPIRQCGTYWYHSHTNLQEQSGVYGAIVIEPRRSRLKSYSEHVVLLSDWTDEDPHEVNRTLKRGSEWYAIEKGSAQSILGAGRLGLLGSYFKRELRRMPAMDIADVAYDRFLANGKPQYLLPAEPDETLRVRIIDGSSTTYFHLEFAGGPMTIVAADGQEVEPIEETRFLIGVAETYDVLLRVPGPGAYELRATAHDGSGYASVWIGSGRRYPAGDVPKPNLYHTLGRVGLRQVFALTPAGAMGMPDEEVQAGRFDQPGMMDMGGMQKGMGRPGRGSRASAMKRGSESQMQPHAGALGRRIGGSRATGADQYNAGRGKKYGMDFRPLAADVSAADDLAADGLDPGRPWPPYAKLRAVKSTAFPKGKPVHVIRLTLDGDMERYVWFLNNKPLSESDSIRIREGEIVRLVMINRTMMHHPMHLHGHFFRVVNKQGDYAPLKHTVDVAPMSTTVIEFDANEFGDWFFHCHLLYHMKSGMARVVHYEGFSLNPQLAEVRPNLYKEAWYSWGRMDTLSHMTEGFVVASNTRNILTADWEIGWQDVDDTEWEGLFTWDRYFHRFFSVFAGADLGNALETDRGVLGIRYLLPFNVEMRAFMATDGEGRVNLGKTLDLTPRLTLSGEGQYDTDKSWEGSGGLAYRINRHVSLLGQWHSEYGFGGGLRILF